MPRALRIGRAVLAFLVAAMAIGAALVVRPRYYNPVHVDITQASGATGFVDLCGRHTPLRRRGNILSAEVKITCEGSGYARLRLRDGRTVTCPIGYVTPGARQTFDFTLVGGSCR